MLIRSDLTHWPLVLIVLDGTVTPDAQETVLAEWSIWLDRGERFAVLWVSNKDGLARAVDLVRGASSWMQANAARLRDQMLGMAGVVPPEHFEHAIRSDGASVRLPDVPTGIFVHIPSALDFLEWFILPPTAPGWDRAAIQATVRAHLRENATEPTTL